MALSRGSLRLMTLNAHSMLEIDTDFCLDQLCKAILREDVDVIALQEVNQTLDNAPMDLAALEADGCIPVTQDVPIRTDNYAVQLARRLSNAPAPYRWTWAYNHRGYDRYEEGVAIFTRLPILEAVALAVSPSGGHCPRVVAGIRTENYWFYSAHMGWWHDETNPFADQWAKLNAFCKRQEGTQYLLGDFNSPAHVQGEGYDLMVVDGWIDCHLRALDSDDGITVGGKIDGWRTGKVDPMRIDFILANAPGITRSSRVIFNGAFYPVISDHYGVLMEEEV